MNTSPTVRINRDRRAGHDGGHDSYEIGAVCSMAAAFVPGERRATSPIVRECVNHATGAAGTDVRTGAALRLNSQP